MSQRRRRRRTVYVSARRNCTDCAGSGWKPVTVVSRFGSAERAVERCACVRIVRLGAAKQTPVDGKLMAAEGNTE